MPSGGEAGYQREFELIHPDYVELTKTCLTWAILAEGDVYVNEVMDAYTRAYLERDDADLGYSSEDAGGDLYKEQIGKASGPFVEVTEAKTIKLSHASVKDFFLTGLFEQLGSIHQRMLFPMRIENI